MSLCDVRRLVFSLCESGMTSQTVRNSRSACAFRLFLCFFCFFFILCTLELECRRPFVVVVVVTGDVTETWRSSLCVLEGWGGEKQKKKKRKILKIIKSDKIISSSTLSFSTFSSLCAQSFVLNWRCLT